MEVVNDRSIAVNTAELTEAIHLGQERDYNRKLQEPVVQRLDPDGVHILMPIPTSESLHDPTKPPGWHSYAHEEPALPHIRCNAWVKVKDQQAAVETTIDVAYELWPAAMEVVDSSRRGRRREP